MAAMMLVIENWLDFRKTTSKMR